MALCAYILTPEVARYVKHHFQRDGTFVSTYQDLLESNLQILYEVVNNENTSVLLFAIHFFSVIFVNFGDYSLCYFVC